MPTNKSGTKTTTERTTAKPRKTTATEGGGEEADGEETDGEEVDGEEATAKKPTAKKPTAKKPTARRADREEGHREEGHSRWPRASTCRPIGPNCDWSCRDTGRADINGVDGSPAGRPHRHRLRSGRLTATRGRGS